jgi:putative ABC transport system permease protein
MKLFRSLKLSRQTMLAHKLRTLLAVLGIAIGVTAVIIMVAIGAGARQEVLSRIQKMGTNLLVVSAGNIKTIVGRRQLVGKATSLTLADCTAILDQCPSVISLAPAQSKSLKVKYGTFSTTAKILGTTTDFRDVRNFPTSIGRYFTEQENKASLRLAVLGSQIYKNLMEGSDPTGEIIRIANIPFEVIGVLEAKGVNADGADEDNQVFIPINTGLRRVFNLDYIDVVYTQVRDRRLMKEAEMEISTLLRERHRLDRHSKPDDFTLRNLVTVLEAEKETSDSFTLMIAGTAAISLFVGGVGVLAFMLLAVKERTNEIGLRMACGARPKDILAQFLMEALLLGLAGGMAGILLGIAGSWGIGRATQWQIWVPVEVIIISALFSLSIGLFFGVYPAKRASRLDPIIALRSE